MIYLIATLAVIGLAVVVVLALAAMQPPEFVTERSAVMAAPAAVVFDQVNDFQNWENWSPWAKMDPNATNTFEGPRSGEGAVFAWTGNSKVGAGRMTIVESKPAELVRIKLEFFRPFKCTNTALFTFKPEGNQTRANWRMSGDKIFVAKIMGLFMDMDKMIGPQFEQGLASMKAVSESSATT